MHKTFSLTDRFLFVLTSYLPFLIFLWVFQMLNGVVLCTTFIATLLFLFLQTTKLKKMGNTYLWCFDNAFTFKSDH